MPTGPPGGRGLRGRGPFWGGKEGRGQNVSPPPRSQEADPLRIGFVGDVASRAEAAVGVLRMGAGPDGTVRLRLSRKVGAGAEGAGAEGAGVRVGGALGVGRGQGMRGVGSGSGCGLGGAWGWEWHEGAWLKGDGGLKGWAGLRWAEQWGLFKRPGLKGAGLRKKGGGLS